MATQTVSAKRANESPKHAKANTQHAKANTEPANANTERARFDRDGFYIFRNVLDEAFLDRLREASDASLAEQDEQHFAEQVATGSMILVNAPFIERYPVFAELLRPLAISYDGDADPIPTSWTSRLR